MNFNQHIALLLFLACAGSGFWLWFRGRASFSGFVTGRKTADGRLIPESDFQITVEEEQIRCCCPDGTQWGIHLSDLIRVVVVTTDEGPLLPDVFWVLHTRSHEYAIPQGATGEAALLERLQQLPNFNNSELIEAMGCVTNQQFECWARNSHHG